MTPVKVAAFHEEHSNTRSKTPCEIIYLKNNELLFKKLTNYGFDSLTIAINNKYKILYVCYILQ